MTVPNVKAATVMPYIRKYNMPTSKVHTDEFRVYNPLRRAGCRHERINHAEQVYVSGDVHVNTIEGFLSQVKRGIGGVYHSVSAKHLQGYLNEYAWRYTHRGKGRALFELALLRAVRP